MNNLYMQMSTCKNIQPVTKDINDTRRASHVMMSSCTRSSSRRSLFFPRSVLCFIHGPHPSTGMTGETGSFSVLCTVRAPRRRLRGAWEEYWSTWKGNHEMLHSETQMPIVTQYQRACSALSTTVTNSRATLIQPLSNHDQEHQNSILYYRLHKESIPPCSTIHYGQVQENQWTQLSDTWEDVGCWSSTRSRDWTCWWKGPTFSMETQTRLRYQLRRSEPEHGILCVKEGTGKYDMWYGVVCQSVMSSCMSVTTGFATTKRVLFPVLSVTSPYLVYYESIKRELIKVCVYFQLD
jgi:hypothetical protein